MRVAMGDIPAHYPTRTPLPADGVWRSVENLDLHCWLNSSRSSETAIMYRAAPLVALVAMAPALLFGCGDPSFDVFVFNSTANAYVVRFVPDANSIPIDQMSSVDGASRGAALFGMWYVGWRGKAIVLTSECAQVAAVAITSDSSAIKIDASGVSLVSNPGADLREPKALPESKACP